MNVRNKFIILSAFRTEADAVTNYHKHAVTAATLANYGFGFKQVEGVYKGSKELSYVVVYYTPEQRQFLIDMANSLEQEAVLDVDSQRDAVLVYANGDMQPVGRFASVGEAKALTLDGYTRDGEDFYACI